MTSASTTREVKRIGNQWLSPNRLRSVKLSTKGMAINLRVLSIGFTVLAHAVPFPWPTSRLCDLQKNSTGCSAFGRQYFVAVELVDSGEKPVFIEFLYMQLPSERNRHIHQLVYAFGHVYQHPLVDLRHHTVTAHHLTAHEQKLRHEPAFHFDRQHETGDDRFSPIEPANRVRDLRAERRAGGTRLRVGIERGRRDLERGELFEAGLNVTVHRLRCWRRCLAA